MNQNPNAPCEAAPWKPGKTGAPWLAAIALGLAPLATQADGGFTYSHAEISVGFPNGQVTFGRTWEEGGRQVTVAEEQSQDDCNRDEEPDVVIEKRVEPRKVVIVERSEPEVVVIERRIEPPRRVIVVREEPRCEREVRYIAPRHSHVTYVAPVRRVTYVEPRHYERRHETRVVHQGWNEGHREHKREIRVDRSGPRDLFGSNHSPRPRRERGVQHINSR